MNLYFALHKKPQGPLGTPLPFYLFQYICNGLDWNRLLQKFVSELVAFLFLERRYLVEVHILIVLAFILLIVMHIITCIRECNNATQIRTTTGWSKMFRKADALGLYPNILSHQEILASASKAWDTWINLFWSWVSRIVACFSASLSTFNISSCCPKSTSQAFNSAPNPRGSFCKCKGDVRFSIKPFFRATRGVTRGSVYIHPKDKRIGTIDSPR